MAYFMWYTTSFYEPSSHMQDQVSILVCCCCAAVTTAPQRFANESGPMHAIEGMTDGLTLRPPKCATTQDIGMYSTRVARPSTVVQRIA